MTIVWLVVALLQAATAPTQPDPHRGTFNRGTGRPCVSCHGKGGHAEDMYRAAAAMEKMTTDLNKGLLNPYRPITCFTCHRGGGEEHNMAHPRPLDRRQVQAMKTAWPGDARDPDGVRRTMSEYSVSLGVKCDYCHFVGNWKSDAKPAMKTTSVMSKVMDEFPKYFSLANASAFSCFTCHQGVPKVAR